MLIGYLSHCGVSCGVSCGQSTSDILQTRRKFLKLHKDLKTCAAGTLQILKGNYQRQVEFCAWAPKPQAVQSELLEHVRVNDEYLIFYVGGYRYQLMNRLPKIAASLTALALTYSLARCDPEPARKQVPPTFKSRRDHLRQIEANPTYDVLVVGGGCNGVGVLLDASTRGLRTLLIQKQDFGAGASSKSTKLIHGGVRYLAQVFGLSSESLSSRKQKLQLVKESIIERSMMIDSATHLTGKIPFVIPCTNALWGVYYYMGSLMYYWIYEWFAPKRGTWFKPPIFFNREELVAAFPYINPKYSIGVVYEDGSFNDSRLLLAALLTATVGNGGEMPDGFVPGNVLNRAEFVEFLKNQHGKVVGGVFRDLISGKLHKMNAKYVVNCTGVWADKLRLMDNPHAKKRICLVGGSHIVYDRRLASDSFGLTAPSADGRVILVQPWLGRVLAGTTEKKYLEPTNHPICSEQQRRFINQAMMGMMSGCWVQTFLGYEKTRWCGLRPLVAQDVDHIDTKSIARTHVIEEQESGLLSLMGGKWTTYRRMGEDLVDLIARREEDQGLRLPGSRTAGLKLLGSAPQSLRDELLKAKGDVGVQLYHTFGWLASDVAKGNLQRVYGSTTIAELEWIVRNELVTSVEDVLMRRTRLCFLVPKGEVLPLAGLVGKLLQRQLGWSDKKTKQEVDKSVERIVSYEFE